MSESEITVGQLVGSPGSAGGAGDDWIDRIIAGTVTASSATQTDDPLIGGMSDGFATPAPGGIGPPSQALHRTSSLERIAQWPIEKRSRLVLAFQRAGLVPDTMSPRYWTEDATAALRESLAFANLNGIVDPFEAVGQYGQQLAAAREASAPKFTPSPDLIPDYASMAQEVKATFRKRLGRDPEEPELAQLVSEIGGWDREARDAEMAAELASFEGTGGTVQTVDPVARFQEAFEQRYANELDFVEDKQQAAQIEEQMQEAASTVSGMARSSF